MESTPQRVLSSCSSILSRRDKNVSPRTLQAGCLGMVRQKGKSNQKGFAVQKELWCLVLKIGTIPVRKKYGFVAIGCNYREMVWKFRCGHSKTSDTRCNDQKKGPRKKAFFRFLFLRGWAGFFPIIFIPEYPEVDHQGEGFVHRGIRYFFDDTFLGVFLGRDFQRLFNCCFHRTWI